MNYKLLAFTVIVVMAFSACNIETDYTVQLQQIKDTIFVKYPTVAAVTINVKNGTNLVFTLGDPKLYTATPERRQQIGNELGTLAIWLFGKGNGLEKGQLIITKDKRNSLIDPPDGIVTGINIDSLNRAAN